MSGYSLFLNTVQVFCVIHCGPARRQNNHTHLKASSICSKRKIINHIAMVAVGSLSLPIIAGIPALIIIPSIRSQHHVFTPNARVFFPFLFVLFYCTLNTLFYRLNMMQIQILSS